MNSANFPPTLNETQSSFLSLVAMRVAHSELLKRSQEAEEKGKTIQLVPDIETFLHQGQGTGALLDKEDDRWTAQGLLDYWRAILYRWGIKTQESTLADFDVSLAPELDDSLCPYLGLDAFRENNHDRFFGRQRLVETLINHLKNHRLLAVVGSSGSGKSSAVMGGLLPKLKAGALPDSQTWHYYLPIVPGSDPLLALARRLQPSEGASEEWLQEQVKHLRQDSSYLLHLIDQSGVGTVVVCVDQFEEVFPLEGDLEVQQAFVQNLLHLVQAPDADHRVILTMRIDFEERVVKIPGFRDSFEQSRIQVTPLDAGELRDTIEKPADLIGLKFEDGLINALIKDALGEPAALPLLQFTLLKLWENRDHNRLTWTAYQKLGGGRKALAHSADEFYNNLIPQQQETAKRILLAMVQIKEGVEYTSKRIPRQTLYYSGEARDQIDAVLNKLIQARLVRLTEGDIPNEAQVEVAHEALIRNWERLRDWLNDKRVALLQQIHLMALAEQWQAYEKDPKLALRGSLLLEAQEYQDLDEQTREFVQFSVQAEQAEAEAERKQWQEKLRLEEKLRHEEKLKLEKQIEVRRKFTIASGIAVILLIITTGWALRSLEREKQAKEKTQQALTTAVDATQKKNSEMQKLKEEKQQQDKEKQQLAEEMRKLISSIKNLNQTGNEKDQELASLQQKLNKLTNPPPSQVASTSLSQVEETLLNPKAAVVIDPPSNVRVSPDGPILCKIQKYLSINISDSTSANASSPSGDWHYTDYCGKIGMIHSSQIKF